MKRYAPWCGLILLVLSPLQAREQPADAKVILDLWDAAYLDGAKMGHQHITVERIQRNGQKIFRTTKLMHITLKRYEGVVTQRLALTTDETPDGKVIGVSMTQYLDEGKSVLQGRVEDGKLIVGTPDKPNSKTVPWNDDVIGYYGQELLFQLRKTKPGDRFRFYDYMLPLLAAVPQQVAVKQREDKIVLVTHKEEDGIKAAWETKKLLRAEIAPEKVKVGEQLLRLPKLIVWLDDKLRLVRQETDFPGLGHLVLYRTTRDIAEKQGAAPELLADLGLKSLIPLNLAIERPEQAREITYRITVKDDDEPTTTFARDARQKVENVNGNTFDLRIRPIREPSSDAETPGKADEKYLKSSFFLDSDSEKIREMARRIVGDETDPWRRGQRIEKWVHEHMKSNAEVNFAPASQVLRDLRGDCRQHAMLTAALCRAVGVPSRTAIGLLYVNDTERGPVLGFHMWTEVWIKGQWLMLDAVLGKGSVGAGHLKISDHSWQDIQTLAPLLPVTRITGKVRVEVVGVK